MWHQHGITYPAAGPGSRITPAGGAPVTAISPGTAWWAYCQLLGQARVSC